MSIGFCDVTCERRCTNIAPHKLVLADRVKGQPIPPTNSTMRMTHAEGRAFYFALMSSRRYLEWGAGGTTIVAAWRALHPTLPALEAHTVESDESFIETLRRQAPAQVGAAEQSGHLHLHVASLGVLNEWGSPAGWRFRDPTARWTQSSSYIQALSPAACCFDTILVDGRFRVACALHALRLAHSSTLVLVHDFNTFVTKQGLIRKSTRGRASSSYANISNWYDTLQNYDTLTVLRPKDHVIDAAKSAAPEYMRALLEASNDPR